MGLGRRILVKGMFDGESIVIIDDEGLNGRCAMQRVTL